jgi:hypothetical protein
MAKKATPRRKPKGSRPDEVIVDPPGGGGGGTMPAVTGPLRAVKITQPHDDATVSNLSLTIFAAPAASSDRVVVYAYPPPPSAKVFLGEFPVPTTLNHTMATILPPNTYMITATILDHAGLQHDVSVIKVTIG